MALPKAHPSLSLNLLPKKEGGIFAGMKIKKRYLLLLLLVAVILLGPRKKYPAFEGGITDLNMPLSEIEGYVAAQEARVDKLRPGNEAQVVWADSMRQTEYSLVYLHGFSASPVEGDPMHRDFAKRYGMNLYLARLAGHGIDDKESFSQTAPGDWVASAKEAIALGKLLGKKVIVMSCSTGGTLSMYLAANNPDDIHAQILYSPNIALHDSKSALMTMPWGLSILRKMVGSNYRTIPGMPKSCDPYWTMTYRLEGLVAMKTLLNRTMTDQTFSNISTPFFTAYYYKNEEKRDKVISIEAIQDFYEQAKTPDDQKVMVAFPNGTHVLPSKLQCEDLDNVRAKTYDFAERVLGLTVAK